MSENETSASCGAQKKPLLHRLFGTTPGDGEMQPKEGLAFSICGFGQNLICTVIGSYLTVFMTDALGFKALPVALLMLFTRIFDALNDPIMGSIVDRTRTKWGKCRPFLKWMAFPIAAMTVICFLPWYGSDTGSFVAISIMYIIWSVIYTVADVPYWGLSTAMSNDTYRRGNLLTIARLFCTAGAGIVTVVLPIIAQNVTNGMDPAAKAETLKWVYFIASVVCCAVALPLFFVGFKHTKERNMSTAKPPSLKHNLQLLFKNKPLLLIVLSGIGGAARLLFTYTGGLYFAKYVLADVVVIPKLLEGESLYTLFTLAIVPGGLIASVLVPFLTKKFGKRNTYIVSHIIGGIAMLIAFVVGITTSKGDYSGVACIVCLVIALVIAGIPSGLGNIVTYAMIGDTVEYLEQKTGERAEGICFAMQTLMNKIGMAVGAFVGVLAYGLANVEANDPSSVTPEAKDTMWIILMLVAAISFFLTVIPLFFYKFNEKEQQEAKEEIQRRKGLAALNENGEVDDNLGIADDGFAPLELFPNESSAAVAEDEEAIESVQEDTVEDVLVVDDYGDQEFLLSEESVQQSEPADVEERSDSDRPTEE